ncbi:MAG: D-alanyl-D-alanine carboxypeptidase family protein [Ruminococcaceae bacterium]|nr:D-alanyl-D-alanine carboxypeptidase family protein [Oscillospiraceae bacterium]
MKRKKNKFNSDFEFYELGNVNQKASDTPSDTPKRLTREERKMIRATKRKGIDRSKLDPYDKSDLAEAKRYAKKNKFKVVFVAFILILLLTIIAAIVTVLILKVQSGPSKADYQVSVGSNEPYKLKYKKANTYGQFYFDLCTIADYAELTVSGTEKGLKFTCPDGESYVRFSNDSATATVNGEAVKVGGKVKIIPATQKEKTQCFVPFKFLEKLFSYKADGKSVGMVVKVDEKNKVTIHRISYSNGTKPPIVFSADCFEYASDMQMYYPNSNIDKETAKAIASQNLTLVNKSHLLEQDSVTTENLISLKSFKSSVFDELEEDDGKDFFDPIAALALVAMLNDANETLEGDDKILVSSAYRSFEYQEGLHQKYIDNYMAFNGISEEEARAQTLLTSAPAGASEHHTGLCVDLVEKRGVAHELSESFEDTEAYRWLSQNAHKYGFILRYPKDKTDITKYSYEPWHYRFVGVYAATIIYEDNITLEEYLADVN